MPSRTAAAFLGRNDPLLNEGVPATALRAATDPFGKVVAALLADERGLGGG